MGDPPVDRPGDGIWDVLRRRKVVQWTVAYAAGAWGLLQGIAYLRDTFDWPRQLQQTATVVLLLGLPVAVAFAWFHGERGRQRIGRSELAVVTLLFLAGGGLFWWYQHSASGLVGAVPAPASAAAAVDAATSGQPSIAVLPFENRSADANDAYFVDGIHDDILTQLSKLSGLKVISRTSVERFRDSKQSLQEIAQALGVTSVLEGGVQRAGDRVRVNVQLIDASTDNHLWAESYDRELTVANIFAIQSEVATSIAQSLKTALTSGEQARLKVIPTRSLEAWEAYQIGRQRQGLRTSEGLAESERQFRRAIELDPAFAAAYSGLSDTLILSTVYAGRGDESAYPEAAAAAARALDLDPGLAEGWTSAGLVDNTMGRQQDAERKFLRAIELNPNYALALHWLGGLYRDEGNFDAAIEYGRRAVRADPLSNAVNGNLGNSYAAAGRFDEAERYYLRSGEVDPSSLGSTLQLALLRWCARADVVGALELAQRGDAQDPGDPSWDGLISEISVDIGDIASARKLVDSTRRNWPATLYLNANYLGFAIAVGDTNLASEVAAKIESILPRDVAALAALRNADLARGDWRTALARYRNAYPELLGDDPPAVTIQNYQAALNLVPVLRAGGEWRRATDLLDRAAPVIRKVPRLGCTGPGNNGWSEVEYYALAGKFEVALERLEANIANGLRYKWSYFRDRDPNLAAIRDTPRFKAAFETIERDMARQRAEFEARQAASH